MACELEFVTPLEVYACDAPDASDTINNAQASLLVVSSRYSLVVAAVSNGNQLFVIPGQALVDSARAPKIARNVLVDQAAVASLTMPSTICEMALAPCEQFIAVVTSQPGALSIVSLANLLYKV
jgi:hypothetical protein